MFAAGDVTHVSEQVLVHIGEGAKAAVEAYAYLLELKSRRQQGGAAGDHGQRPVGQKRGSGRDVLTLVAKG